jgi:hypothetical protein
MFSDLVRDDMDPVTSRRPALIGFTSRNPCAAILCCRGLAVVDVMGCLRSNRATNH